MKEVIVTDIKMSFGSMILFMVKWVLASIPAAIILSFLAFFLFGFIQGLVMR